MRAVHLIRCMEDPAEDLDEAKDLRRRLPEAAVHCCPASVATAEVIGLPFEVEPALAGTVPELMVFLKSLGGTAILIMGRRHCALAHAWYANGGVIDEVAAVRFAVRIKPCDRLEHYLCS